MLIAMLISGIVILSFCIFLFGLAIVILIKPKRAERFLSSYASSARAHYTEQVGRLVVGAALVILSPFLWYSDLLSLFCWVLIITTIGLLLTPWRWHNKFGEWAIPLALRYMKMYSIGAFLLGGFILYCLFGVLFS